MTCAIQLACPVLAVSDVSKALLWYRDRLGFTIASDFGDYGIAHRDAIELHFWKCIDRRISEATSAYLRVKDLRTLHSTLTSAREGGRMDDPVDTAWGMSEFHVWDPDGSLLRFGEPIDDDLRAKQS